MKQSWRARRKYSHAVIGTYCHGYPYKMAQIDTSGGTKSGSELVLWNSQTIKIPNCTLQTSCLKHCKLGILNFFSKKEILMENGNIDCEVRINTAKLQTGGNRSNQSSTQIHFLTFSKYKKRKRKEKHAKKQAPKKQYLFKGFCWSLEFSTGHFYIKNTLSTQNLKTEVSLDFPSVNTIQTVCSLKYAKPATNV